MQEDDVVILPFPFTDLSGSKFRPAIILDKIATIDKLLIAGRISILTNNNLIKIDKNLIRIFQIRNI